MSIEWLIIDLSVLLVLVALYPIALLGRRRFLSRHGGTLELSHRVRPHLEGGRGWSFGIGRYREDRLEWFPIFSLRLRPARTWARDDLHATGQRDPSAEEHEFLSGQVVVAHRSGDDQLELAMSPRAVVGYLSWLESAPPGGSRRPA